jgi:Zn-dependent protease
MNIKTTHIALAVKFGPKIASLLVKLVKSLKVMKLGMGAASLASYSWMYGLQFACIIIIALIIHESGHVYAMRRLNIPTKGFYLIPFVGAAALSERDFHSRWEEFVVAIAGPVFGLFSALVPLVLYFMTDYPLWAGVAAWISMFNLFNLLPITPLDGGRVVKSFLFSVGHKWGLAAMLLGLIFGAALLVYLGSWLFGLILCAGCIDFALEWRKRNKRVPTMEMNDLLGSICFFFALAFCFFYIVFWVSHVPEAMAALEILRDK